MLDYSVQAKNACALEDLKFNCSFQRRNVAKVFMPVPHTDYRHSACRVCLSAAMNIGIVPAHLYGERVAVNSVTMHAALLPAMETHQTPRPVAVWRFSRLQRSKPRMRVLCLAWQERSSKVAQVRSRLRTLVPEVWRRTLWTTSRHRQ